MADHTVTVACPPQNNKPCTNSVNNFANLAHGDMTVKDEGLLSKPHKDADRNINHCNGSLQTESDFTLCKGIKENEAMKKCFNDHSMISDITVSQLKSKYLEEVNGLSHRVIRHSSGDDLHVVNVLNTCKREAAENEIDDCSGDSNRLSENTCLCKAIEYDVFCDNMESEKRFMPEAHYNTGYNDVNALLSDLENTSLHDLSDSSEICISSNDIIDGVSYVVYESEKQMPDIMRLITKDLSEPYSIYTYRYFIHNWPKLCFLAISDKKCVGAIVCKLDLHKKMVRRGYIAMLAVDSEYRRRQIGSTLVTKAIEAMIRDDCDEVVLETEITNQGALHLYENLGFVRDKRLFRYYLNGVDALRLKLWLR